MCIGWLRIIPVHCPSRRVIPMILLNPPWPCTKLASSSASLVATGSEVIICDGQLAKQNKKNHNAVVGGAGRSRAEPQPTPAQPRSQLLKSRQAALAIPDRRERTAKPHPVAERDCADGGVPLIIEIAREALVDNAQCHKWAYRVDCYFCKKTTQLLGTVRRTTTRRGSEDNTGGKRRPRAEKVEARRNVRCPHRCTTLTTVAVAGQSKGMEKCTMIIWTKRKGLALLLGHEFCCINPPTKIESVLSTRTTPKSNA